MQHPDSQRPGLNDGPRWTLPKKVSPSLPLTTKRTEHFCCKQPSHRQRRPDERNLVSTSIGASIRLKLATSNRLESKLRDQANHRAEAKDLKFIGGIRDVMFLQLKFLVVL